MLESVQKTVSIKSFEFNDSVVKMNFELQIDTVPGHTSLEQIIALNKTDEITLIELKTTKKKIVNNPHGFFFGATESEFALARQLGNKYKFCFVSLHPESKSHKLLTLEELNLIIRTKRIQYQINL